MAVLRAIQMVCDVFFLGSVCSCHCGSFRSHRKGFQGFLLQQRILSVQPSVLPSTATILPGIPDRFPRLQQRIPRWLLSGTTVILSRISGFYWVPRLPRLQPGIPRIPRYCVYSYFIWRFAVEEVIWPSNVVFNEQVTTEVITRPLPLSLPFRLLPQPRRMCQWFPRSGRPRHLLPRYTRL